MMAVVRMCAPGGVLLPNPPLPEIIDHVLEALLQGDARLPVQEFPSARDVRLPLCRVVGRGRERDDVHLCVGIRSE